MPYTPPSGDAIPFSWADDVPYTPPAGDTIPFDFSDTGGAENPFGDVVQPLTVRLTSFGDVAQDLDVDVGYPFGDVAQPLDVNLQAPWTFYADRVMQPLNVRLTSFGDVEQPLAVNIAAPHGDVQQALAVRLTSSGDVIQPLSVAVNDPTAVSQVWRVRVMVGGVDISNRTTGRGSTRAEEGGARIASIVMAPEVGPLDAAALSGSPVIIDFQVKVGGNWSSRRLFTGIVADPVYSLTDGTLTLSCTDNRQNRLAALSRATIDAVTGGRFHLAVQGEQRNNLDYAEAVMETVSGSLDLDVYGGVRVTPWHTSTVWRTYTLANTEQDSIFFTLPPRNNIINKIVGIFEYRFTRLHRRTAHVSFQVDLDKTVQYGLPLLARSTVEAALENTGWSFYYGGGRGVSQANTGTTPFRATNGEPVKRDIDYTPYPDQVDIPGGGIWYQTEQDTTCMEFSCSMWRRWPQEVTEVYTITVTAPESIAANGVRKREDVANLSSKWDAGSWENNTSAEPTLNDGGRVQTLDYAPDATTADRDAALVTFIDTLEVQVDGSHRDGRGGARTWLTPELDVDKRVRIDTGTKAGEGKVRAVEHNWDMASGRATTDFEIAITRHDSVGITPPDDTETEAPPAPAVPEVSSQVFGALSTAMSMHIGGLESSPEFDENWTGWIVNVPSSYNIDDPGSTAPRINPETQKTEKQLINDPYTGSTANPLYRPDKAYPQTGFRVVLPEVESSARDAIAPAVTLNIAVAIPQDELTITA
jgi:hypothetical protein